MLAGLLERFSDPKTQAGLAAGLSSLLMQFAAAKGWHINQEQANAATVALVSLAGLFMGAHAHETASETKAQAVVNAAHVAAGNDPDTGKPVKLG